MLPEYPFTVVVCIMAGPRCVDEDFPMELCRDLRRAVLGVGCSVYRNVADAVTIPFFPLAFVFVLMVRGGPVRLVDMTILSHGLAMARDVAKRGYHSNEIVRTVRGGLQLDGKVGQPHA